MVIANTATHHTSMEVPVVYCRDNAEVQAYVAECMRDFDGTPAAMRDMLDGAIAKFGLLGCFYFEIQPH